jgi:rhodanese-related sulfurtransferase
MLILDVRRLNEWNTSKIEGAKLIPLQELDQRANEIAEWKNRPIVVHCHHGVRSMNGTAILRKAGFTNVHSMAGGIDAWSLIVDPGVPRY